MKTNLEAPFTRPAPTDRSIHPLLANRYSPHAFADRAVPEPVLERLLEAARWAPSSFNEQPWRFVVGDRERATAAREAILDVLAEGNRAWASQAPVLVLASAKRTFAFNGEDNPHAWHDVGLATAQLTVQATAEGLGVHQMAGFDEAAARERFAIPDAFEPVSVSAIGYPIEPDDDELAKREEGSRERRPLEEIAHREEGPVDWPQ